MVVKIMITKLLILNILINNGVKINAKIISKDLN